MKITTEDLGSRQILLTIEVDQERVDGALRGVARRISRQYNVPGFRRGRAPYDVVLRRFGREALLQEALDEMGQEVIQEALEKEDLDPYGAGELEDVQLDPLVLKLRLPLRPKVELGEYRSLRLAAKEVAADEAEIDAELERLREANAVMQPADDRPAKMGDWVTLDVNAVSGDDSLVSEQGYGMVLNPEDKEFEQGFAEQIVGMKPEEGKEFTLTLGDNWGADKTGQEATFSVTVRAIRGRLVPELDDDLARTVGDYDTLEELVQGVRSEFEERAQAEADRRYVEEALESLVAGATIEYPPDLIEDQIDDLTEDLERRLEPRQIGLEDYIKLTGQTEESFRNSLRPRAETIVRRGLVLGELARQEKLDIEENEVDERIVMLSASWGEQSGEVRDMLSEPDSVRSIANSLLTDKAVQRLVAIAKGEAPPLNVAGDEEVDGAAPVSSQDEGGTAVTGAPSDEEAASEDLDPAAPAENVEDEPGELTAVETSGHGPDAASLNLAETTEIDAGESSDND